MTRAPQDQLPKTGSLKQAPQGRIPRDGHLKMGSLRQAPHDEVPQDRLSRAYHDRFLDRLPNTWAPHDQAPQDHGSPGPWLSKTRASWMMATASSEPRPCAVK